MLKFVIVFTAILACTLAAAVPEGLLPQLDGRIIGGYETSIEAHPYQVSLQRSGSHFCGGSIHSGDIVVTAAHCLQTIVAKNMRVRVGSSYWNTGGSIHLVKEFINHPGYNPATYENDIAIIRIDSSFSYKTTTRQISMARVNPRNGVEAVVSGWGKTSENASGIPKRLLAVNVDIIDRNECAGRSFSYGSKIKTGMICARADNKDACQGDSGGPLVSGGQLVGVVSWGYGCAKKSYPGVYADVAHYYDWIDKTAKLLQYK